MDGWFSKRIPVAVAVAVAVALGGMQTLRAQARGEGESLLQQQRVIDERLDQQRKELAPLDALLDWQWGGWLEYYIFHFNDGIQSQRVYQRPGMSLWTRLSIDRGAHEIFARMRLNFEYFNPGDEYDRQQDWVGPNLDRGWYQIDLGRALRLGEPDDPLQMRVRLGRQEVRLGTGYTLDMPLDAVKFDAKLYDLRVIGLFAHAISSYPNVDRSYPVDTHSARRFFGVQVNYEGFENHQLFGYALWNDDYTDERPTDLFQNYSYDTRYFGVGSRGSLAHNLNYWTEWVYEGGHSYGDGDFRHRDTVDAWAGDIGLEYLWDRPMRPEVSCEYMFASGDSGRLLSPTNARGGNRGDHHDTSFVGFGYRDTGISAAPTRSNMHIWRVGGSLAPLDKLDACRDLEIGTNWFLYHKHHHRGAISDYTAGQFEGYVGWEMDYFINWRFASDLSWTIRWGAFFPGDAFQDRSTRNFLFTGMTWSF
jgi:hypothetical protein